METVLLEIPQQLSFPKHTMVTSMLVFTAPALSRMTFFQHINPTQLWVDQLWSAWLTTHLSRVSSQLPPTNFLSPQIPHTARNVGVSYLFYFFYSSWSSFHNGRGIVSHNVLLVPQQCSHLCFSNPWTELKGCNKVYAGNICLRELFHWNECICLCLS